MNYVAYACIAAGIISALPWRKTLAWVCTRKASSPTVEPQPSNLGEAPVGTEEYLGALRKELAKESAEFILGCAVKGLSVTDAIREAYNKK